MEFKSPFRFSFSGLPSLFPYRDRKALNYAFWNAVVFVCLIFILILCTIVFFVFQVFLRPICWALIVGTCLFPCKLILATHMREYLHQRRDDGYLFFLAVAVSPIHLVQFSVTKTVDMLWSKVIPLIIALSFTGAFLFMEECNLFSSVGHFFLRIYFFYFLFLELYRLFSLFGLS